MKISNLLALSGLLLVYTACANRNSNAASDIPANTLPHPVYSGKYQKATFALGCFWHSEEMFSELKGVVDAVPGYCGGKEKDPSYEQVSTGTTRYAESVDISFDPTVITY